ncbi:MAG TPA: cytochrome c [Xanthobacteraceae bacterium]|nr:cytochrome c [Xanthobacteraceae bacterium]
MLRSASVVALVSPFLLAVATSAFAQDRALGERLFNQSCVLCHKNPQINAPTYAPALSEKTLGGKADIIHETISNGTPRMPGFKIQFTPEQIDSIVAYIKTLPAPADTAAPRKAGGGGGGLD